MPKDNGTFNGPLNAFSIIIPSFDNENRLAPQLSQNQTKTFAFKQQQHAPSMALSMSPFEPDDNGITCSFSMQICRRRRLRRRWSIDHSAKTKTHRHESSC